MSARKKEGGSKQALLREIVNEMRKVPEQGEYFALTLTASESGKISWGYQSSFAGYSEGSPRREIRKARIVSPAAIAAAWTQIGQSYVVVRNEKELLVFLQIGGNALVEKGLAELRLGDVIEPSECGKEGLVGEFVSTKSLPSAKLNHAPTPKIRMEVFKRDGMRCKVCGRRPADYVDVEIHVHHIQPWAEGGLTAPGNLIALCHTCHKGLEPHREYKLFELIDGPVAFPSVETALENYKQGVSNYMRVVRAAWERNKKKGTRAGVEVLASKCKAKELRERA